MKTLLADLQATRKLTIELTDEFRRLDIMEAEAKAKLDQATEGDLHATNAQRIVGEARVSLDLVANRRRKLKEPWREHLRVLTAGKRAGRDAWNTAVLASKKAKVEELTKVLLPFFEGDERGLRRKLDGYELDAIPCFEKFRRAFFNADFSVAPEDQERDLQCLIGHVERHSKVLGIN